jgi:predicted secreted protein
VDVTTKSDVPWKQLMAVGIRSLAADCSGAFTNDVSMNLMMSDVMTNNFPTLRIISGRLDIFIGVFQVGSIERTGEYNKEEQYSMKLESAGVVAYTPGA